MQRAFPAESNSLAYFVAACTYLVVGTEVILALESVRVNTRISVDLIEGERMEERTLSSC